MSDKLYCVNVFRELEEPETLHYKFDHQPSRNEILAKVMQEDLNYDDNYGKLEYWEVKQD